MRSKFSFEVIARALKPAGCLKMSDFPCIEIIRDELAVWVYSDRPMFAVLLEWLERDKIRRASPDDGWSGVKFGRFR